MAIGFIGLGNLGSAKHFDYSFIGDAGNLAARLEGVNKVFGTDILVSQTTYEKVHDVVFRHIGTIKVVGRAQALNVYQPLTKGYDEKNLTLFQEALRFFETMEYEKAKECFANISEYDFVAARYLMIINDIMLKKLLWDDALVLSTK